MHAPLTRLAAQLVPPQPDGELLARFVRDRDEVAFAALVHRHGPTVYGVCRRRLGNGADADDAFQAVFLVLMTRAGALPPGSALGGWLHGVAVRVADKARTSFARLRKHERRAAEARSERTSDPLPDEPPVWLDREVAALPERYREPVVRCLIQERSRAEVAAELGIPEGTLASRLDTARKRLADRLARHRAPLVFGALLVPVPVTLAATTVSRVTDGAGAAIHQLANEVANAMHTNTTRIVVVAAGALCSAGGLLLAAGGGDFPAPQPLNHVVAHRPAPVPPEPEWVVAFRKTYALKDGEYAKRVAPPYIDARKEYMYRELYGNKQTPEVEAQVRERLDGQLPFLTLFLNFDEGKLTRRVIRSSIGLAKIPKYQSGERIMNVWDAVTYVTGLEHPEIVIDPKSKGHPLLSTREEVIDGAGIRGNLTVNGDFVTRKDAPLDKLVPQLERIFREECKLDVRLTVKEEEQEVFVVGGTFKPNPPAWRPKKELDFYATEEGLNKEYDHFGTDNDKTPNWKTVDTSLRIGTLVTLVRSIGDRLGTRMVWDTPLPTVPRVSWHHHTIRNPTKEQEAVDRDPEKILPVVTAQTGLTFKKETRRVQVLYLSAPEQK